MIIFSSVVAVIGDVRGGAAAVVLRGAFSLCRRVMCHVVFVCAYRTSCRGGQQGSYR